MRRRLVPLVALLVPLALALAPPLAGRESGPGEPASAPHGMVVAPDAYAAEAGRDVLAGGGNAVDAAVAAGMVLTVTYPIAAPVGGGGFLLHRGPGGGRHALDFRETAPRRLRARMFLDADGRPVPGRSLDGGLAVGVPGGVAGLHSAWERWGTRPWDELLRPAIRLAEDGFFVSEYLARTIAASAPRLARDPATHALFRGERDWLRAGERLRQPRLAATLRRVAEHGPDGFYRGPVAREIVAAVRARGGVLRRRDLRDYRPVFREPLVRRHGEHTIVTFPPPSSGGVAVLQILGMLERMPAGPRLHRRAEAFRRAFADRSRWLGDPDAFDVPLDELLAPAYLERRVADYRAGVATPSSAIAPGRPREADRHETLHLSVVDADDRAVSLTMTLNRFFGAAFLAGETGVLLNNELDDFAIAPGVPNLYGLVGGEANAVEAGKRPLSSMTPTLVEDADGRPLVVLGSPGGSRIITAVTQVLLAHLDEGRPLPAAVAAQRMHQQWLPDVTEVETLTHDGERFGGDAVDALRDAGHEVAVRPGTFGAVNAIGRGADGRWVGVPDPRRHGFARGH